MATVEIIPPSDHSELRARTWYHARADLAGPQTDPLHKVLSCVLSTDQSAVNVNAFEESGDAEK